MQKQHPPSKAPSLLDVACQKSPVEVTAYCVIDKSFLSFGLPPSLVLEDNIIIPPPFHLCKSLKCSIHNPFAHYQTIQWCQLSEQAHLKVRLRSGMQRIAMHDLFLQC